LLTVGVMALEWGVLPARWFRPWHFEKSACWGWNKIVSSSKYDGMKRAYAGKKRNIVLN